MAFLASITVAHAGEPTVIHARDDGALSKHPINHCKDKPQAANGSYVFHRSKNTLPNLTGTIGNITITRLPIFDEKNPNENNSLYLFANRFHILTTESNVQQQLLFKEGEPYNPRLVNESARILRESKHLIDAGIRYVSSCDDKVNLEVITRDIWSLNVEANVSRTGGDNSRRLGLSESNLFGSGKKLSIVNRDEIDRNSTELAYKDLNVLGSRVVGQLKYANNTDGSAKFLRLALPFYALAAKRSWGILIREAEQIDSQYLKSKRRSEIRHNIEDYNIYFGFSKGLIDGVSRRWTIGYRYRQDDFSETIDLPSPRPTPRNQTLSYPYLQYTAIEDKYATTHNLRQINRIEDIHSGYTFRTGIGLSNPSFGTDDKRLIIFGEFSDTLRYNKKHLLKHSLNWYGQWNNNTNEAEDSRINYDLEYIRKQTEKRAFVTQFTSTFVKNLNTNAQLVLGGKTGARGFNKRFQSGNKRILISFEERQYTNYQLFNLAYLGFAAFIDIGRAWQSNINDGLTNTLLVDAGIGLRLASSKADAGRVIHIDLAFPLTNRNDPDVDGFQILMTVKNSL